MAAATTTPRSRMPLFWLGCALIAAGVALHLPMLAMAHSMGNHFAGMPMDPEIYVGMLIAVLLPYAAENYPLGVRGRATGLIAGASKVGGVAVQAFALVGLIPTLGGAALGLLLPMGLSAGLVAHAGRETRGRSLRELEAS